MGSDTSARSDPEQFGILPRHVVLQPSVQLVHLLHVHLAGGVPVVDHLLRTLKHGLLDPLEQLHAAGSLRIEKTSSDGKVEGFSFRVTGANGYDQTFKTDKNGEIFIEGLRVGDYTVSEVSDGASANYVLPADKTVTIFADKTTVAEMHNELRDTPKTGDDSKPWLWAALMGVSAMGAAALGVAAYVGKRKKDNHTAK